MANSPYTYIYNIYHIFFIYLSLDGHLGCFHVLAIVNTATMNTEVHVSFWIIVLFRYMPTSGIAGSYGNSILVFWDTSTLFSTMATPIYIPTNSVGVILFLESIWKHACSIRGLSILPLATSRAVVICSTLSNQLPGDADMLVCEPHLSKKGMDFPGLQMESLMPFASQVYQNSWSGNGWEGGQNPMFICESSAQISFLVFASMYFLSLELYSSWWLIWISIHKKLTCDSTYIP